MLGFFYFILIVNVNICLACMLVFYYYFCVKSMFAISYVFQCLTFIMFRMPYYDKLNIVAH
jgi:hypothetical protein